MGCGDIAQRRVAPALSDLPICDLVSVARSRFEMAEAFAKQFGVRKWAKTWQELVRDPEIDAVYVATPVYLHCEITESAAENGKHVLCEKPMAISVAECDRMIEACRSNRVKLGVAYYRRFYPVLKRIKNLLASAEIGRPVLARLEAFEHFNPKPGGARTWLLQKDKAGGGPLFDFGCHRVEVLLDLFGPVARVRGFASNALFKEREVEDTASVLFEFQSGCQGVLSVSHAVFEKQDAFELFGSEGTVRVPILNEGILHLKTKQHEHVEKHPPHPNIHQPLIEDFARALLDNRDPAVDGSIGREVNRILADMNPVKREDKNQWH